MTILSGSTVNLFKRTAGVRFSREAVLIATPNVQLVKPGTPGSITIVHHVTTLKSGFKDILTNGLKSREVLASEGRLLRLTDSLDDYNKNIYFRPPRHARRATDESFIKEYSLYNCNWVAIDVDPRMTYVFDGNYRFQNDKFKYFSSRTLLQDLLDSPKAGSWEVIFDIPIIEPKYFSGDSSSFLDEHRHDDLNSQHKYDKQFGLISR